MRNVLAVVPKESQEMVASIIRTIFAQPDREHIEKQFGEVTTMLGRSHPKVAAMLTDAQPDLLAFAAFPRRHWRQTVEESAITDRDEDFVQFVRDDIARRRAAEDAFYAQLAVDH